jgi:hypothetical protein
VALILVLLAILVLTTLAAAMVFSARSETLASYNYRIGTQAEYVALAGVQRALNFFNSSRYAPVPPGSATTYYNVSIYATNPVDMYFANATPVACTSNCTSSGDVFLGTSSGSSTFPPSAGTAGVDVVTNWVAEMNNQAISDGLGGTGNYTVAATLLEYHTVNNAFFGIPAAGCSDSSAALGICRQPFEVWRVTSTGTWNSNLGAGAALPTVQVVATISPMYVPYFGSALYGLCNVTLSGNVCTDSYNSTTGQYGGSVGSCATASTSSTNAAFANAGVGSNGGVSINGSAVRVGGNVTYANANSDSSCNTGFQGTDSGIGGSVLPGPAIPTPPVPDMAPFGYNPTSSTAPDVAPPSGGGGVDFRVANVYTRAAGVPTVPPGVSCPAGFTGYLVKYTVDESTGPMPHTYTYGNISCSLLSGSGSSADPYRLGEIEADGSSSVPAVVNIIAPAGGIADPTYIYANEIEVGTGGFINLSSGAPATPANTGVATFDPNSPPNVNSSLVLAIADHVNLGGTSSFNYSTATPGIPSPDYLKINILGTSDPALDLTGQSKLNALVTVPNGGARLAGSGVGGAFFGSILAKNVTDAGNYAVHYDLASRVQSGKLFTAQVVSVTRPKF